MIEGKLREVIAGVAPVDRAYEARAQAVLDNLTKPQGSLGRLEHLARRVAGITRSLCPPHERKVVLTMAADHGVVAEGVSAFPQEVTRQMVHNFVRGGAAINVLARHCGARVVVVDMGVAGDLSDLAASGAIVSKRVRGGTGNIARGPAMSRDEAVQCVVGGIEAVEQVHRAGVDLLAVGDMGIGNTTPSSAIIAAITRSEPQMVTGRGTGVDDESLARKVTVIERALRLNKPDPNDALDVLSKVGGFEIGGLAGAILCASAKRVPVAIDGLIATAGALLACTLCPTAREYIFASHRSQEPGHQVALRHIGQEPLLDLGMRLGEGTGAVIGLFLIEAGIRIMTEMASFSDAGVAEKL